MTDPMQAEREAFEAWGLREGRLPAGHKRTATGRYFYIEVQDDWECWQAALASHASELRSLRDALALARSHIGELRESLEVCLLIVEHFARDSAPDTIAKARAALKEKGE